MIMETMLSDRFFNELSESGVKIPKKAFLSLIFDILGKKTWNFSDIFLKIQNFYRESVELEV